MRILFISWWWPYPANNGSKIRIYNLLRHLSVEHEVSLLSFAEADESTTAQIEHLRTFCTYVESVPKPHYHPNAMRAQLGYFSPWPRSLVDVYSDIMAKRVVELVRHASPDVMIASQFQTMRYLELVPEMPAILEEIEVTGFYNHVERAEHMSDRFRARFTLNKMKNAVRSLLKRGVAMTVVSQSEKDYLGTIAPEGAKIVVIPNGVDTTANCPDITIRPKRHSLIYTGAVTYSANYDAVAYFIRQVLPLVRQRVPDVQFTVTGTTGDMDISDLAARPGVTFSGLLPSVADAVRESWALVAPLRVGGGTRLKILEAMALGTPVISTRKGAEGLAVTAEKNILLADDPQSMAEEICRLFQDETLRNQLASAGRELVKSQYDWSIIGHQLNCMVSETCSRMSPQTEN